jgi:pimeloyl-ACP methyl ester carboxylesterase
MFFDRRNDATSNSKTLVICCEGNAGFYEIGMISTPIELGYSILGWNHPGFGGSTGVPYPKAELNAAEAVFDFATNELGFDEQNILIYGWSIGGFPASHLARSHPNIKGLIIDASFDDIMPLALPRMPVILSPVVHWTIRNHVNLQVSQELAGYAGPIRIIRRTEDEIIADPPGDLKSNRGNYILKDLIQHRFPELLDNAESVKALDDWIDKSHARDTTSAVAAMLAKSDFVIPENLDALSIEAKKQLVVKIADHYLTDFKSSHCTQLPASLFQLPWSHSPRPIRGSSEEPQSKQKAL